MNHIYFSLDTGCVIMANDIHIQKEKIEDFNKNIDELYELASSKKDGGYIVINGDVFEARDSQPLSVLLAVKNAFKKLSSIHGFTLMISNGNHDKVDQESIYGYCDTIDSNNGAIKVISELAIIESKEMQLSIIPYFPEIGSLPKRINDFVNSDLFSTKKTAILYGHAGILGSLGKENINELSSAHFKQFDKVLMGHYHNRSVIDNIEYIGSSRQFNYGEDTKKGYNIIYPNGKIKFVQNKVNTRYQTITVDFKDISDVEKKINKIREEFADTRIRVIVNATPKTAELVDKKQLKDWGANRIIIEKKITITDKKSIALTGKMDMNSVIRHYGEYCNEINIDKEMGINYLTKKD